MPLLTSPGSPWIQKLPRRPFVDRALVARWSRAGRGSEPSRAFYGGSNSRSIFKLIFKCMFTYFGSPHRARKMSFGRLCVPKGVY